MAKDDGERPIIIVKKIKKISGGHHGGAWKVAYADFVTAMMAFFLLLWILNVSEKETLNGLADYFTPTTAAVPSSSGAGSVLGGNTITADGAASSGATVMNIPTPPPPPEDTAAEDEFDSKIAEFEDAALMQAAAELRQAIQKEPELLEHNDQLIIEQTPDGMRIQIVDKDSRPMFRTASATFYNYAIKMISEVGGVIDDLPNRVAVVGHTDSLGLNQGEDYTNWELSADRANAARRVLRTSGVTIDRFSEVTGKAETEPMFPDDTRRAENRRITILVMREAPVISPEFERQ